MKPIRATVLSSKSVSLKKAAFVLARFQAAETAQQDVAGFLRRTSEAASELVQFYRLLLAGEDSHAEILPDQADHAKKRKKNLEDEVEEDQGRAETRIENKKKKKKRKEGEEDRRRSKKPKLEEEP
ncbi:nucleolar-like protein [Wolffia australiana]